LLTCIIFSNDDEEFRRDGGNTYLRGDSNETVQVLGLRRATSVAVALASFETSKFGAEYLPLEKNDQVSLLENPENGEWQLARKAAEKDWIPAAYVERLRLRHKLVESCGAHPAGTVVSCRSHPENDADHQYISIGGSLGWAKRDDVKAFL
jgi:hypothetical protein